jgi:hypothetical protein
MDAKDLIKLRRQQTEDQAVEHEVQRSEATQRSHTGNQFNYVGRNPATGDIIVSNGDIRVSGRPISNSELTSESVVQILDPGVGTPAINFAPSRRNRPVEPQPSSEEFTGSIAVLLDTVVSGDVPSSCRTLQDIWALFAIVRYVKAARTMVLFSFPVDTGSPVPYACPRYNFTSGSWTCDPTADVDGAYDDYAACVAANPVTCPGGLFPPGLPIGADGLPNNPGCSLANSTTTSGYTSIDFNYTDEFGNAPSLDGTVIRHYTFSFPGSESRSPYTGYGVFIEGRGYVNMDESNDKSLIGTWTRKSIYKQFQAENGRAPVCGDTITVSRQTLTYQVAPTTVVTNCDGSTYTSGGDVSGASISSGNATYAWQPSPGEGYSFIEVTFSNGCGSYGTPSLPPPPENKPTPRDPDGPTCSPPEGTPSTFERQFWVGGHIQTPIKLTSINAEEEYEYFGSLMPDGYYVTLKWGRHKVNGTEEWCKVQTFKTTNLVDWRTTEYHESLELSPTPPSGIAGTILSTKGDRANVTDKAVIDIDPTQNVVGSGNITRTLNKELLTRPQGSFVNTLINAKINYVPNTGATQVINTQIYRIVQVIPASLNTGTVGCIEVGNVELAYSPLFIGT